MAGTTHVERAIDNIRRREWAVVREQWLAYVPQINPAGSPPALPLADVPGLADAADEAAAKKSIRIGGDQNALRSSIFWEGTYLLHKACHIIGAGGLHAGEGLCTWSISSFYQGGLFGAKAILYLLGIGFPEFKSKTLLVDIWPEQSAEQRRMERRGFNPPPEAQLTHVPSRLDHHASWYALLRVLRTSKVDVWPSDYVNALRTLNVNDISDQRNAIHYHSATWLFDDLYPPKTMIELFHLQRDPSRLLFVDPERDDFTIVLSVVVLNLALSLFASLGVLSNNLKGESDLLTAALSGRSHLIYRRAIDPDAAWASAV